MERGLCVVRILGCVLVQLLKINGPPERPVLLGAYDHSIAPSVRGHQEDLLQDSEADIPVKAAFTSSCQCMGMAMGVWWGLGVAAGSMLRLSGGPDIMGRVWCSQTLKALAAYRSRRYCSSQPRLASVAGNGRLVGLGGVCALFGHE